MIIFATMYVLPYSFHSISGGGVLENGRADKGANNLKQL